MEKFIAFGLYRKNEHGAHQEAMEPGEAKPVYLVKDVDARVAELEKQLREANHRISSAVAALCAGSTS
jgi:hypothetical protein